MNVTKEVTIHRPNFSTLLSSAFIRGDLNAATRGPSLDPLLRKGQRLHSRECGLKKNLTMFWKSVVRKRPDKALHHSGLKMSCFCLMHWWNTVSGWTGSTYSVFRRAYLQLCNSCWEYVHWIFVSYIYLVCNYNTVKWLCLKIILFETLLKTYNTKQIIFNF